MPQNVHFRQRAPAPPPMAPKWYLHKDDIVGTWGESNSPRFYNFCVQQFMPLSLFRSHSLFFSFPNFFLAFHPALRMPKNRKRKQKTKNESENEAKTEKMNELLYTEMAKSGTIGLASGLLLPDGGGSWWWGCAGWRLSWRRIWWESWRPAGWPPPPAAPPYLSQIQSWARVSKITSPLAPVRLIQTVSHLALSQTNSRH